MTHSSLWLVQAAKTWNVISEATASQTCCFPTLHRADLVSPCISVITALETLIKVCRTTGPCEPHRRPQNGLMRPPFVIACPASESSNEFSRTSDSLQPKTLSASALKSLGLTEDDCQNVTTMSLNSVSGSDHLRCSRDEV